jgi:DNA-binding NarL/FixJ family response regulator
MPNSQSVIDKSPGRIHTADVLIVEDEALVATYIADVLQESGFRVIGVASTGTEALTIARESGADVALVDIKLAGPMDGIEVARQIRQQHGIGAIFLSGTSDPEVVERAAVAEPYGFLQKPFLPSQVYKALDRALKQRRAALD